jgi:hypothetical protein
MKTTKSILLASVCFICISIFGCKKDKTAEAPLVIAKEIPTRIQLQNSVTAATESILTLDYDVEKRIVGMLIEGRTTSIRYVLNYNQDGGLNSVSIKNGSLTSLYSLEYSNAGILNKIVENENGTQNNIDVNYLSNTNTYVLSASQRKVVLDGDNNLEKIENWYFGAAFDFLYTNKDGIFANVNLDPSAVVFFNALDLSILSYFFLHKKQISSYTTRTSTTSKNEFSDYKRDDNDNLISFQYQLGSQDPVICTVDYQTP